MNSLKSLRENANLSQKEVAERMNVGQTRVSAIERTPIEAIQVQTLQSYATAVGAKLTIEVKQAREKTVLLPEN